MLVGRCNACGAEREFPSYFKGLALQCKDCGQGTLSPKESDVPPTPRPNYDQPRETVKESARDTTLVPTPIPSDALLEGLEEAGGVDLFSKGGLLGQMDQPEVKLVPRTEAPFADALKNFKPEPVAVRPEEPKSLQKPNIPTPASAAPQERKKVDLDQFSNVPPEMPPGNKSPILLFGLLLAAVGAASVVLPFAGVQLKFMVPLNPFQPWMGMGIAVVGALLILLGFMKKK